ncbi:MAG: glycosyltransferase [Isosphaeraceae bacterium]
MEDARFDQIENNEEWIDWLESSLEETRDELDATLERVQELERRLEEITDSPLWKLDRSFARGCNLIAPPGSGQRRLLHVAFRGLRALPKLRHRAWVAQKTRMALDRAGSALALVSHPYCLLGKRLTGTVRRRNPAHRSPRGFPVADRAEVSIIIPVFNHCRDTLMCLESIERLTTGPAYEVIVVDDASTDETPDVLGRVNGLITIRNEENLGFIGSCNRGAKAARGEHLVFLNNDTLVTSGWLEALATTFEDFPGTGLVGAKLVYPDGRLQEAGALIWRDASGWNYGKHEDPNHPQYNFAREVDYCSGACVMVPRFLFEQCGGFDEHYAPAYYEDADLAFKIRRAGYKVVYQPLATIVHHEGLTSGRSVRSGAKAHQPVNQAKFQERWRHRLSAHPTPYQAPSRIVHPHGEETEPRGRVLVIDHRMLTPDRDAGSMRMLELIRGISQRGHHVSFLPDNLLTGAPYHRQLQRIGVEVLHHPYCQSVAAFLKQNGHEYDLVILSRAEIAARHMTTVRRFAPQAKVVFDTVDLHFLRETREAELKQDPSLRAAAARRKQQELRLVRSADLTLVASPAELEMLERECPWHDVRVFPTVYRLGEAEIPDWAERRNIVFIGSFEHPPNVDAVLHFAREILPTVLARIPEAVFQVIGSGPTPEILALAGRNIEILGFVPDVAPYFRGARLSVAPLRFGAGVKGKVNQSMALGVPTVVSSIAAEGMHLAHEENAMIADDPEAFAAAIVRVWTSPELWRRLSEGGRANVREYFSVEATSRRIDGLLSWVGLFPNCESNEGSRGRPVTRRKRRLTAGRF